MDFDSTLLEGCLAPIPGDNAAGESARYEPQFEAMQAEIDKLSALTGEAPDWALVTENAALLLSTKSKDLLLLGYLAAGLTETRGWAGLANGIKILRATIETFWEGIQPMRLRARKTAVDWLLDRTLVYVEAATVVDSDREAMLVCVALVDELVVFGESRWEGDAPTLWSLSKAIGKRTPAEVIVAVESASESASDGARANDGDSESGRSRGSASVAMGSLASRDDAYRAIKSAAELLQVIEPHSPVSYLLRRAAMWGAMPLPELYAELQRAGTVWDLVLQALPAGPATSGSTKPTTVPATTPRPAPAPEPVAPTSPPESAPRPARGDF